MRTYAINHLDVIQTSRKSDQDILQKLTVGKRTGPFLLISLDIRLVSGYTGTFNSVIMSYNDVTFANYNSWICGNSPVCNVDR